ncbi:hypothetical protein J1N35_036494 [Gossypium stocksii]|uniref:Endonuclease/exonuclease/phosphatase domain-containing protein n=1 Tax=Gossypium stocksii TaxID=47602 RepID=A0A9D3ZL10_9ROSI|nr:hypothetical protein J1N35_036494 [Gossypium stocksii]
MDMFSDYSVQHLKHSFSDHCPILIQTRPSFKRFGGDCFEFESWWLTEPSCEKVIKEIWQERSGTVLEKLEHTRIGLQRWAKNIKGKRGKRLKRLQERLTVLDEKDRDDDTIVEIIDVKLELNWEMEKKEMYWEQRARLNWLRQGDKNIAFFHNHASQRRRMNMVRGLEDNDGIFKTEDDEMGHILRNYFMQLFESSGVGDTNYLLSGVSQNITKCMNQLLTADYKEQEVTNAI